MENLHRAGVYVFTTFQTLWCLIKVPSNAFSSMVLQKPLLHFRWGCWGTEKLAKVSWASENTAAVLTGQPGCVLVTFLLRTSSSGDFWHNHCEISVNCQDSNQNFKIRTHLIYLLLMWGQTILHTSAVPISMCLLISVPNFQPRRPVQGTTVHATMLKGWVDPSHGCHQRGPELFSGQSLVN